LIAGKAGDLLSVIKLAKIGDDEDDQALLTDFMYRYPDSIVLDYGQKLFGNNRGGLGGMDEGTCTFALPQDSPAGGRLVHSKTLSSPLFVHSPGGFLQCHDELASELGMKAVSKKARRRLKQEDSAGCNYRKSCTIGRDREWGSLFGPNN
jgi:hypothetical protein